MRDIAVRRSATLVIVLMAAILLLLLAGSNIGRATLAAATSGHNGPIPTVIDAGTSNHLTITVKSAPTHQSDEHDSSDGGDGGD